MTDTYNSVVAEEERQRRERATRQGAISPEGHRALAELAQRRDALAEAPTLSLGPPRPNWTPRNLAERERYDQEMSRWNYQRSQAVAARFNVSLLGDASPDEVARRQRNAELYGTSAMSTDLQRQQRDAEIISASPQFSDHFANPINAELSRDDIRPLSFWQIIGDLFRMSNTTGDFSNRAAQRQAAELAGDQNRVSMNIRRHVGRGVYQSYIASLAERENVESALDAEGSNSEGAPLTRRLGNVVYRNSRMADEYEPLTQTEQYELNAYRHDEVMGLISRADMTDNFGGWFLENIVPTAQGLAEIPGGIGRGAGIAWERAVRNWEMGGGGTPADAIERTWAVLSLAPDVAVSGTIGAFTGPIAYTYQQEAGNAYLEFTQMMDDNGEFMDRRIAGAYARDVGSINSIFELVNLTVIGKALGVGKLGGFLASAGVRSAFRRYALNEGLRRMVLGVGETALSEGVTEAAQEVSVVALGDMARMADSGELDMLSPGEVASRLFDTVMANSGRILEAGVAGAIIGGGIGTVVAPITIGSLIEDARVGEYQQEIWRSIETQSESSKLRERAPGVYQRLISKLVQGTPLEQIAINVEDFIGAFHQDVDMARAAARELEGVGAEAFDEAQKTGGDIFIPASTMSAQIAGTEQYQHIAEHSKLGPDVASIAEVKARLELGVDVERAIEAGTKLNEQLLTLEEAKGRVRQEFLDRLNGSETWSQSEFNDALAELFAEGYFTIAKAAGMDPEKMPSIPVITGPFGQRQMTQAEIDAGGFSTQEEELSKKARGATAFQRSVDTFMTGAHIAFTETRNESTAPHEIFGHYFLELLRFAAAQSTATPILKQDWQTTLDYLGMTDERWEAALRLQDKAEAARQLAPAHEKFARAVEVYFKEGRAPSPRLKRVFRMFKVWMVRAFRVTKRMDAQQVITHPLYKDLLDDRIRPVLDRMFASQEAVAEYAAMMGSDEIMTREEWGGVGNKHADASYERYKNGIVNARRRAEEAIDAAAIAVIVKENMRERRRAEIRARKTAEAEMAQDPAWIAHDIITGRFELPNTPGIRLNSAMIFQEYGKDTHASMPRGSFDIDTEGLIEMAMEARGVKEPTRFAQRVQQLGIHDPSGQIEAIQGNKKGLRKAGEGRLVPEAIQILWDEGWFGSRNNAEEYFQGGRDTISMMARDGTQAEIVVNPTKTKLMRMTTAPIWDRQNPWNYDTLRWVKDDQGRMYVAPARVLHDDIVRALTDNGITVSGYLEETQPNEGHGSVAQTGWIRREGDKLIYSGGFGDTYLQSAQPDGDSFEAGLHLRQDDAGNWFVADRTGERQSEHIFSNEIGARAALQNMRQGLPEMGEIRMLPDGDFGGREPTNLDRVQPNAGDTYFQSFDTDQTFYHGTRADVRGALRASEDGLLGPGVYIAVDEASAGEYATGDGGQIIPVYKRQGKIAHVGRMRGATTAKARAKIVDDLKADGFVGIADPENGFVNIFNEGDVASIFDSRASETYFQPFDGDVTKFAFDEHDTLDRATGDSRMRVSTRQPSSVYSEEDPINERLVIGLDSVLAEPVFAAKVAEYVRGNVVLPVVDGETDTQTLERYIQLVIDNLLWLHDSYDAETRDRADEWYTGARVITEAWMMRYGYHDYVIAGVIAALSPQLDWFQNVSLAERVLDVYSLNRDFKWTPEMQATADRVLPRIKEDGDGYEKIRDDIDGRSIAEIEQIFAGDDKVINILVAAWVRVYDQTYNDASYRTIMPEGSFGDFVKTTKDANARVGWKSLPIIANAISMIRNPSYENISSSLGAQHKVRNFYNNILAPNAPHGDVTIDTHAVAAAQLRPLSQADKEVVVNLSGAPKSAITGSIGTYGVHAEAYRRAAVARGILPRQMQSITWEAVRTLFTASWKTEKNRTTVNNIWQEYRDGKATIEETREKIATAAGGIKSPAWVGVRSADGLHASEGHSTYEGEIPRARVSRWTAGMDARVGRPAADRVATRSVGGERYFQLEEEFFDRSEEMVSRVVGDVGLTRDETLKIYEGLLADHNEKMRRAMRLSLGLDATNIGTREARAAEAQVEAISSYATITDLMGRLIARYGQDAVVALGAPISWDMRDQMVTTEDLNRTLRERVGEATNLKRMRSFNRVVGNDYDMSPERIDATLIDVNAEAELIQKEIERRTKERALGAWQPTGGLSALARATNEEVMDWFYNSGEVRVGKQRDTGDPVIHFKTDPTLKNFNARLTFDQQYDDGFVCTTHYRGRFNNRNWDGSKQKPTAAQRQLAMAFFARMALVTRAFVIMNKPVYLKFTGGSTSHDKLYLSMMRLFDFQGYTARRERAVSAHIQVGPRAGTRRSTVAESITFFLLRPDEALKRAPADIPPTAVSESPFASNQIGIVGPGEGERRRPGTLIWFSEETLDVKNPTGATPTRDPKASRYFSRGDARDVRFVPLGIGSDDAVQASSIGAKETAIRTLDEAEGWFYQEEEAPTEGEFLDALRDDVSGVSPRYRAQDINASLDWQEAKKVREFFARRGIDISSKPAELEKQIGLIAEQLDDRGVDADTMASALNAHLGYKAFASGREMIDAVAALPKRGDHIKQRVDQIVRGELGDPMDDMPSAAALSMHNINEEQRILMELQATQEAAGSGATRAINRTAKEYAERRVSKMSVRQIQNPDWALATERRWAKAATEAMRKGDAAAANKAKLNQLIHFHIYKLARATKNEMDRAQLYFKKLQKLSARTRITPDYFEQIDALLDQYELRNMSTKEVSRRISLSDWVKSMEDRGLGHMVQIDPEVIARSQRIPFQQLTIEQARALRDAVKNLDHLGTLKDKLLTAAEQRSFEAVLVDLIGAMEATGPVGKNVTRNYSEDDVQKVSARMRRWNAALTRMEFLFRYIDGQHNGKVWRTLFLPFTKAADIESAFQHRVAAQLTNLWDKYSPSERASMFKTRITIPELAVDSDVTGLNDTFTRMELIAIALNLGNNGNVAALVDGFKWFAAPAGMETDYAAAKTKIIAALDKHLTKRDWEFVQETWSIIGQFRDEAFNLHQRLTGLRPEEVEADPIASKHGTFAGGYYPLKFDPLRDAVTERREAKENTPVSNWGVSSLAPMTKKGHLIDRKGSGGRPVRLDFGVATDHIQNVIHDIAYREALIDANRIISDERFRAAFIRTVGKEQYAQLHPWLHSIAVEYRDPTSDIGKLMQRMRGNMQIVTMGAKIATATQQIAGLLQAVPMLGSAEMAGGVIRMLSNPFALREKSEYIMSKSEFMRTRVRSFNRDVREFLRRVQDDTLIHKTQRNAFALVGAIDWAVSSVVWITAYEKARAGKVQGIEAGIEEDAVRFADSMVRQTQSAGLNQDLPLIMRNTEMEKLITAFYSYFSVLYNWTTYDQVLGVRKGRVPLYMAAGNFFLIYIMAPILTEWLAGRWDKDGEDDEEKLQRMLSVVARMPFSSIPLVRDVANTVGTFYGYSLTPFESGVQAALNVAGDVASGDILTNEGAQKNAAFAVGFVFGLPTAQVYITADYLRDYAEGEEEGLDLTEALLRDTR